MLLPAQGSHGDRDSGPHGFLRRFLALAPGNDHSYFHWGVRQTRTGLTECPLVYATPQVRESLLALLQRDLPGKRICYDQTF